MYKRVRFATRFTLRLLSKYYLVILLGLGLGIASFLVVPRLLARLPYFQPQQRIGLIGRPTMTDLPLEVLSRISIGLTTVDTSGLPSPGMAESWTATDSGKTYIFTLKTDLKWQDGTPLKSADLDLRFKDATVEFPDSAHVVIKLPDSFAPLPVVVSRPIFKQNSTLVGVGAYRLGSVKKNGSFVESINLDPVTLGSVPRLRYSFYASAGLAKTAFKLGLVNQLTDLSDIGDFTSWPNINVQSAPETDRYVGVFFNLDSPDLTGTSGKNLRLALAYAIDKSMYSPEHRAIGPIGPQSWAFNPDIKTYDYDLNRAKTLLAKVEKVPSSIDLIVVPAYFSVGEKVKADWEKLGLKVNLHAVADVPENFTAVIVAQAVPADPDQYNLWHSTQKGTSLTNINNPRIDKLLEDGRKTLDHATRRQIYADFQRFLVEEMPVVFLEYPEVFTLTRK